MWTAAAARSHFFAGLNYTYTHIYSTERGRWATWEFNYSAALSIINDLLFRMSLKSSRLSLEKIFAPQLNFISAVCGLLTLARLLIIGQLICILIMRRLCCWLTLETRAGVRRGRSARHQQQRHTHIKTGHLVLFRRRAIKFYISV